MVRTPVFTPAEHLLFIDDMTLYNDNFVQHKWHVAQGVMVHDFDSTARETLDRHNMVYMLRPGDHPMVPVIRSSQYKPKYITFECDFWLMSSSKKLAIDFPDKRGYKHTIAIDDKTLFEKWQGSLNNGIDIIKPLGKGKQLDKLGMQRWHCLAIAVSEERLDVFLDGMQIWGIGHDSARSNSSAYLYDGYLPSSFTISCEGYADLRHVRFAQSDKIPPPFTVGTEVFNTLFSGGPFFTQDIHFETGKAILKEDCYYYLNALVKWMKENPAVKNVEVSGHTDSDGDAASNTKLSEERAHAVVNYIVSKGISRQRLKHIGYGSSQPLMANYTEDGKAANRRVELRITPPNKNTLLR